VREMYDDNIYLCSTVEIDDFITLIRPEVNIDVKTERTDIKGGITLNVQRYADESQLNTTDQIYALTASFLSSEQLSLGLNGRYIKDTTLETELTETGIGLIRTIRKNYFFSPSATYILSEIDSLTITPFYARTNYQSPDYSDYWVSGVNLNYRHLLKGERLSLIGQAGYNYVKFKPSESIYEGHYHNCQFYGGINYLFSETITMNFLMGLRYTNSKMAYWWYPFIILYKDKTVGWVADASLSKTYERGSLTLGARREILPSGWAGQLETNTFYIYFVNKFTERLHGRINISYYKGEYPRPMGMEISDYSYHTWHIIPTLHYYLMKHLALELNYSYTSYKSTIHSDRNTVFLGIRWEGKYLWE